MSRTRLTPEQIATHRAGCSGCELCEGSPPAMSKLEQRAMPAIIAGMFGPVDQSPPAPSAALLLLQELIGEDYRRQRERAALPRQSKARKAAIEHYRLNDEPVTREQLLQSKAEWIALHGPDRRKWILAAVSAFGVSESTIRRLLRS